MQKTQKQIKIAFDLGGVIIKRTKWENFLISQSVESVRLTVLKFGPQNVFIISKAKEMYIKRNIQFLKSQKFFEKTGFIEENIFFVENKYKDKGPLGVQLGIDYIVDDSTGVAQCVIKSRFKPILFGDHQQYLKQNKEILNAKNWRQFREILEKPQFKTLIKEQVLA